MVLEYDTSRGLSCSLCPNTALDLLGHHAATRKKGGDVVTRHNQLRDSLLISITRHILVFMLKLVAT